MKDKNKWGLLAWVFIFLLLLYFIQSVRQINVEQELPYSTFKKYIKAGEIIKVTVAPELIKGQYKAADGKVVNFKTVPMPDPKLVEDMEQYNVSQFSGNLERGWLMPFLMNWGPMVLLILFWLWMIKGMQGGGKQVMAFGRSKAKLQTAKKTKITFADVAGCDEAKEELKEIVEFLKDPAKFQKLGGKIPKGVLVYGSPGTGKTLLAKAVAGEAGVPFFSSSGSEFVEMEGFDTKEGVILIAATNRPDVLDPALLRPGRFDRQIAVPMPDLKGRDEILKVHAKSIKLADEVNLNVIARRTPGFVGADIANLVNEAALLAARKERQSVGMDDLEEAIDRVIAGPQRKSRMISDREKKIIAYHESGHALVAKITPGSDPVHKVSIIPRGPALGYTLQLPLEDKYLTTRQEIQGKLAVLLGGRVAEEMIFNEITTGAQNDLSKATSIAHKMVVEFGMSEKIGALSLSQPSEEVFLGRDFNREPKYSNKTAEIIDEEVKRIVTEAKTSAEKILRDNAAKLKALAEKLIEKEILDADEVDRLLNPEAANETKPEEQEKKA